MHIGQLNQKQFLCYYVTMCLTPFAFWTIPWERLLIIIFQQHKNKIVLFLQKIFNVL